MSKGFFMNREQEYLTENALLNAFRNGQISRRQFMQMMIMAGLGAAGVGALGASPALAQSSSRPLTPPSTNGSSTCTPACRT